MVFKDLLSKPGTGTLRANCMPKLLWPREQPYVHMTYTSINWREFGYFEWKSENLMGSHQIRAFPFVKREHCSLRDVAAVDLPFASCDARERRIV